MHDENKPSDRALLVGRLREVVEALDRRVPQSERKSENGIAQDAAALKRQALERIAQLEG